LETKKLSNYIKDFNRSEKQINDLTQQTGKNQVLDLSSFKTKLSEQYRNLIEQFFKGIEAQKLDYSATWQSNLNTPNQTIDFLNSSNSQIRGLRLGNITDASNLTSIKEKVESIKANNPIFSTFKYDPANVKAEYNQHLALVDNISSENASTLLEAIIKNQTKALKTDEYIKSILTLYSFTTKASDISKTQLETYFKTHLLSSVQTGGRIISSPKNLRYKVVIPKSISIYKPTKHKYIRKTNKAIRHFKTSFKAKKLYLSKKIVNARKYKTKKQE